MRGRIAASCFALLLFACASSATAQITGLSVKPSAADPRVKAFDDPSVIMTPAASTPTTPLVLFLTGTGGKPEWSVDFLKVVAGQGYRVISLAYNDEPAVSQVCPRDPDPKCSGDFREMRLYGDGPSTKVSNPVAESIQVRLVALLSLLAKGRPAEGWGGYLKDGATDWSRIVVSGLSQGRAWRPTSPGSTR